MRNANGKLEFTRNASLKNAWDRTKIGLSKLAAVSPGYWLDKLRVSRHKLANSEIVKNVGESLSPNSALKYTFDNKLFNAPSKWTKDVQTWFAQPSNIHFADLSRENAKRVASAIREKYSRKAARRQSRRR